MPKVRLTELERLRRHRQELELAIVEGLPLGTARRICQDRRRRARVLARQPMPAPPAPLPAAPPRSPTYWWERD